LLKQIGELKETNEKDKNLFLNAMFKNMKKKDISTEKKVDSLDKEKKDDLKDKDKHEIHV
jgi:hypothetical protein